MSTMISKEEVQKLAELARLQLTDGEVAGLQQDISSILQYVESVSTVQIPSSSTTGGIPALRNAMRADTPRTVDNTLAGKEESLRAAFPKRRGGFNVVRKIIQKDE